MRSITQSDVMEDEYQFLNEDLIKEALEIILDKRYHPLMVMCS